MVDRSERRWLWGFAVLVLVVTGLPYLVGYWAQGNSFQFLGFVFGVDDGNSYIAKMLAGAAGDWLFRSPYTAYPQAGAFSFFPYILLGKLSAPPGQHAQLVFLFQVFRCVGGILVIFSTYDFVALFIKRLNYRRLATAVAVLGGGLGWLFALGLSGLWGGRIPLEFYSPETFGYLAVLGLPHLEVARALLLWGLRDYLQNVEEFRWARVLRAGLLWLGMGIFQPLTIVTGWAVLGLHMLAVSLIRQGRGFKLGKMLSAERSRWITSIGMVLLSSPIVIYTLAAFNSDPYLRGWTAQNLILSPPVTDYLLAFATVLPLAIAGLVLVVRRQNWDGYLPAVWVVLFPILAYVPYNLQRRLPDGIWVALVILAFLVIDQSGGRHKKLIQIWAGAAFLSTLLFTAGAGLTVANPQAPLFIPQSEVRAFTALGGLTHKDDVVLADFRIANEVPAWLPVRTLVGHGPESVNASLLTPRITSFFAASGQDADRLALIHEFNIKFIVLGPAEMGGGYWNPSGSNFLTQVFQDGDFKVYQVLLPN